MRHALLKKLNSKVGESLIESLVAILIFTMASIIMYSMVTVSADINLTAKEKDAAVHEQLLVAEKGPDGTGAATAGTITMTITSNEGVKTVAGGTVNIYGTPGSTLYAYYNEGG